MTTARTSVLRPPISVMPGMTSLVSHSATAETTNARMIRLTSEAGVGRHSHNVSNWSL